MSRRVLRAGNQLQSLHSLSWSMVCLISTTSFYLAQTSHLALEDSLSGSESSDESDSSESDAVNNLVSKAKRKIRLVSPDEERKPSTPQTALTWFHSPPSTQIGVYRALYSDPKDTSKYLDELREMQHSSEEGRQWAMFMVAGGHFAGAIVQVSRQSENEGAAGKNGKNKLQKPRSDTEVLRHKTFHRYTSAFISSNLWFFLLIKKTCCSARRKQGGSQSLNDNAKGNAKSAGALLRRYGEQSLRDVRDGFSSLFLLLTN